MFLRNIPVGVIFYVFEIATRKISTGYSLSSFLNCRFVYTMPEADSQPTKKDSFAALRYKDFRSYLGMRFFFTFAYQMQTTVLGFYIYTLTHSKVAIAFIGLSEAIPAVGIALYGGYIADKYEKRKMLLLIYIGVNVVAGYIHRHPKKHRQLHSYRVD